MDGLAWACSDGWADDQQVGGDKDGAVNKQASK